MKFVVGVAALACFATACGDNLDATAPDAAALDATAPDATAADATAPDSGAAPDAGEVCITLALGRRDFHFDAFRQILGVRFPVETPIGAGTPEELRVELYDSTTGGLPPLATGTSRLDEAPDDDLATCQHCIWMPLDWDGSGPLERILYATEGTITLTQVDDPLSAVFAATTSAVVLREATLDEAGTSTVVDGGRCVRLEPLAIDTRPTPGQPCLSAESCGNPLLEVCSPRTATCKAPECGEELGCPAERPTCVIQYGDLQLGACYATCNPSTGRGCAADEACLQFGVSPDFGLCYDRGTAALGEPCAVEDVSSSCTTGARCSPAAEVCTRTCDVFAAEPGCQDGAQCNLFGVCDPPSTADPAALGAPCATDAELADGCAADGEAFRGICFAYSALDPTTCQEACLGDRGCEAEEFCALRFTSGLGVCLPDPVCGDGVLGEIDEVCDDGNTRSSDGCSGDCQTVEYEPICSGAAALVLDATASGNTADAWDGFQASCQLGIARADVYDVTAPGRGRLRLRSEGPTQHVVSLRRTCADAGSELACADDGNVPSQELIHQVTDPTAPLTLVVSAFTVLEQGPYAVTVEWTDESCGDGVVAGLEVCDDGNTTTGDGCRADCREIEYAAHCAAATPLPSGTALAGDLTGAPHVYAASCSNPEYGSGADRLYRVTAARAGTLRISVSDATDLLTLAVFDGCGVPGSFDELACTNSFLPEPLEVVVTAGQTVTVLVEGFSPWASGGFSVRAELLPP